MNPINEYIYNKNISRQINLIRHRNGLISRIYNELRLHDREFTERVMSKMVRLSGADIRKFLTDGPKNTDRIVDFYKVFDDFARSSYDIINNIGKRELIQLSIDEYNFQAALIETAFEDSGFSSPKIKTINYRLSSSQFNKQLMVGSFFDDEIKVWASSRRDKVLRKVRTEISRGKSISSIEKSLVGTKNRFSGILKDTHLGAVMRVETGHIVSTSAAATILRNLNPDIKIDFLYSAILDKKSSGKCFTRHNKKVFKELKGEMSPIHYRCRTRMIPFIGTDEAPKQESINRWFTGLSELEKIEFLGKKKFEVFNKNKKSFNLLRDFISEDSEIYTLKQLKNKGVLVES